MTPLLVVAFALVAAAGGATALVRDPARQAIVSSVFGLAMVLLFTVLQAPDVALSALVVSAIALPAMILLALAQIGTRREADDAEEEP